MAFKRALVLSLLALVATAGVVLATHEAVGLSSQLLARGTLDRSDRVEFLSALAGQGRFASNQVATVKASLAPGGTTKWHGHLGPSIVVVTAGTLTVTHPMAGGCMSEPQSVGDAFFHTGKAHNFENKSATVTAEFYVTYFVSAWPPNTDLANPC